MTIYALYGKIQTDRKTANQTGPAPQRRRKGNEMYYLISAHNIKTGQIQALMIFTYIAPGTVIEWGTDDGETLAKWKVDFCELRKEA